MQSVSGLLYSLYRITLVDEYEYAAMVAVDDVMAPLLCGTFLAASSILCVNMLIALLTDTFQRSEVTPEAVLLLRHLPHYIWCYCFTTLKSCVTFFTLNRSDISMLKLALSD